MESSYRNFYRQFYIRTGGFIPTWPLNQNIFPGDFFQIRNGEMIVLGNIFMKGILDPADCPMEYGIRLNPVNWNFSDGLRKPYSGRGTGAGPIEGHFEFSKQILAFDGTGSFFFKANQPEATRISNWDDFIQQQLIIKMTQIYYSFRELYLVTESVSNADWTLAISGSANAELEIATDTENFGLVDVFGHHSARTIQSKDIEYYHRETRKKPSFFMAKKLVVQEEKMRAFTSDLIRQRQNLNGWASEFFDDEYYYDPVYSSPIPGNAQACVLDMLSANELNPNTALMYFRWADTSLDDIEKFFLSYGK